MRNTTGYLRVASKFGGLISQYCTCAPAAPVTVLLSAGLNETFDSQLSFSLVSAFSAPLAKSTRKMSDGDASVLRANTANWSEGSKAEIVPPFTTTLGV